MPLYPFQVSRVFAARFKLGMFSFVWSQCLCVWVPLRMCVCLCVCVPLCVCVCVCAHTLRIASRDILRFKNTIIIIIIKGKYLKKHIVESGYCSKSWLNKQKEPVKLPHKPQQ